jgi:hypothetical protein
MQRLNQLQRQTKNGSNSRHEEEGRYHERRDNYKNMVIQEVIEELIDITHLTQQGNFMHLNIP